MEPMAAENPDIIMSRLDPFKWLSPQSRKRIWLASLIISAALLSAMNLLDVALKTAAAPSGIISFEFAGNMVNAQRMLASWDADARVHAALSLGIDYLFLVAYALVISMACAHTANTLRRRFKAAAAIGFVLAWAQFLAAGLDAVENAALIRLLLGSSHSFYPLVAWVCAGIKFGLVGLGLAYLPVGFILGRLVRRS